MNSLRRWAAVGSVLLLSIPLMAQQAPVLMPKYNGPNPYWFIRTLDTTCAVLSDTIAGPSVFSRGARQVIWRVRANSGTCSLIVAQVSNNDSTWKMVSNLRTVKAITDFAVNDSLNTGGVDIIIAPKDSTTGIGPGVGIPWNYTRVYVQTKVGFVAGDHADGPTVLCRTKVDSLRFTSFVQLAAP